MSTNGNYWKPRKLITLTCPSGQKVLWKQPGPEFTIKFGRIARTLATTVQEKPRLEDETEEDYNERVFNEMSDAEVDTSLAYMRHLLVAGCVTPRLYLNPQEELGQTGPDDLPDADFWFLVNHHAKGAPVPVADVEVEAKDLSTFPVESGVSGSSVDSVHLPSPELERTITDQGLGNSAGG